ncbi:IS200/IS605 family transposase [Puteibacter caeruleilacunae]|nr:IS200/IS605 family transposase [Puteibacter caeruleilacunae]
MSHKYSQCYMHLVFAVKHRKSKVEKEWKTELANYLIAVIQAKGHKVLAINCMPEHTHIFIIQNMTQTIPDLMKLIKTTSHYWLNKQKHPKQKFVWQVGYGVFSFSRSHIGNVIRYINNQEEHHKKVTFREEFLKILKDHGIEYDPRYLGEILPED